MSHDVPHPLVSKGGLPGLILQAAGHLHTEAWVALAGGLRGAGHLVHSMCSGSAGEDVWYTLTQGSTPGFAALSSQ